MPDPQHLQAVLDEALAGRPLARLAAGVERLRTAYRAQELPTGVLVGSDDDAAAYAAYRMPATHAAVRACLAQAAGRVDLAGLGSVVDLGAGTGAASWALADLAPGAAFTLLEQSPAAAGVGQDLAARSGVPALQEARWLPWRAGRSATTVPPADLVVAAYLLAELDGPTRRAVLDAAAAAAPAVLVVEPGTPAGHARVLQARDQLLAAGLQVVAPCPHDAACPLTGDDWCHFSVRVTRSERHRRLKDGTLGFEDEKFSFVLAVRVPQAGGPAARVVRRPGIRKGLVALQLCRADGTAGPELVSKRQGDAYRAARRVAWGDAWPPA